MYRLLHGQKMCLFRGPLTFHHFTADRNPKLCENPRVSRAAHTCLACRRSFRLSISSQWSYWSTPKPALLVLRPLHLNFSKHSASYILRPCASSDLTVPKTLYDKPQTTPTEARSLHPTEIAHTHGLTLISCSLGLKFGFVFIGCDRQVLAKPSDKICSMAQNVLNESMRSSGWMFY